MIRIPRFLPGAFFDEISTVRTIFTKILLDSSENHKIFPGSRK